MCRAAPHLEHIIQFYSLLSTEKTQKAEKFNFDPFIGENLLGQFSSSNLIELNFLDKLSLVPKLFLFVQVKRGE